MGQTRIVEIGIINMMSGPYTNWAFLLTEVREDNL